MGSILGSNRTSSMPRSPVAKRSKARAGSKAESKRPRGTGAAYIYERLKVQILHLELMPGTLLDETELAGRFGLSRSPVREALIRLSAEGLVQNPRNRTSIVAQFDVAALPAYFDAMQLIYRLSGRLAASAPHHSAILEKLYDNLERHEATLASRDIRAMIAANREFHMMIAEIGGNPYVANWLAGILDQGQRLLSLYGLHLGDQISADILKPHREIVAAVVARDPEAAEQASAADAQSLIDEFMQNLGNRPGVLMKLDPRRNKIEGA
jgi:DNA-binding GntR family transcriptional regulator